MPRYYFDIREGPEFHPDRSGQVLPDLEAAEREANRRCLHRTLCSPQAPHPQCGRRGPKRVAARQGRNSTFACNTVRADGCSADAVQSPGGDHHALASSRLCRLARGVLAHTPRTCMDLTSGRADRRTTSRPRGATGLGDQCRRRERICRVYARPRQPLAGSMDLLKSFVP
jgi:hypothetical protein